MYLLELNDRRKLIKKEITQLSQEMGLKEEISWDSYTFVKIVTVKIIIIELIGFNLQHANNKVTLLNHTFRCIMLYDFLFLFFFPINFRFFYSIDCFMTF